MCWCVREKEYEYLCKCICMYTRTISRTHIHIHTHDAEEDLSSKISALYHRMDLDESGAVPFSPPPPPPASCPASAFFLSVSIFHTLTRSPHQMFFRSCPCSLAHRHSALSLSLYDLQLSLKEMNEGLMKLDFGTGPRMRISAEDFEVGALMYVRSNSFIREFTDIFATCLDS